MLLNVKNLCVRYGESPTVEGVSFSLDAGQILAIVGESGSGKTTVIRAILNVLPRGGRIIKENAVVTMAGRDLLAMTEREWQSVRGSVISMIFQDSGSMLNPVRTIGSQFVEYIRAHSDKTKDEAAAVAEERLALMNLPDPKNIMQSYTFELSGGMRQRVGIAMAITFTPKLLLADEPTSALDVTTQAQIVGELMYAVKSTGASMIVVTHNLGVASFLADNIMVMQNGKAIEYGATEAVLQHPKEEYTKTLLAAVPEAGGKRYVR